MSGDLRRRVAVARSKGQLSLDYDALLAAGFEVIAHVAERDAPRPRFEHISEALPALPSDERWWVADVLQKMGHNLWEPLADQASAQTDHGWREARSGDRPPGGWGDDSALEATEPHVYVRALTGADVQPGAMILCPFPDHDDTSPSLKLYPDGHHCFGCRRSGRVYQFAGALWGYAMPLRGQAFLEVRDRVRIALGGVV